MPKIARWVTLDFFKKDDLPPVQMFALLDLDEHGRSRFTDLCRRLHISAPTATALVDRLQQRGLVKRRPDPLDRRAILLELTPQGHRLARRFRKKITTKWGDLLEQLSADERRQFVHILEKLHRILEE